MSIHAICPVEWGEISTKQSVGKCKQINLQKLPIEHSTTCDSRIHMNCIIYIYNDIYYNSYVFWNHN